MLIAGKFGVHLVFPFNLVSGDEHIGLIGFWNWDFDSEVGTGLIFGAGVTVLDRGRHNLQVGAEYAPVFTDTSNSGESDLAASPLSYM